MVTRDSQKRTLADNLKLKQYVAQAAIRQKEMERMSEKMKNHDFDKVDREKRKINEHVSQLEREQSERTGRLGNYRVSPISNSQFSRIFKKIEKNLVCWILMCVFFQQNKQ